MFGLCVCPPGSDICPNVPKRTSNILKLFEADPLPKRCVCACFLSPCVSLPASLSLPVFTSLLVSVFRQSPSRGKFLAGHRSQTYPNVFTSRAIVSAEPGTNDTLTWLHVVLFVCILFVIDVFFLCYIIHTFCECVSGLSYEKNRFSVTKL